MERQATSARDERAFGAPARAARWRRISTQYLLPVASSGTLTWGALLESRPILGLGGAAPLALLGVGLGAAVGAVWGRIPRGAGGPNSAPSEDGPPVDDGPVAPPPPRLRAPPVRAASRVARSGRAAARPPSSRTAEQLWAHWLSNALSGLPVELVGPVPETAYSAPRANGIPERISRPPDWSVSGGRLEPLRPGLLPSGRPRTPTEDAIRLGRALSQHALPREPGRTLDGIPDPEFESPGGEWAPLASADVGTGTETPSRDGPEAAPAVPRLTVVPWTSRGSRAPATPGPCSTCDRPLVADAGWQPCPECDDPVCARCRTLAVIEHGQTWCADCARSLAWDAAGAAT